MQAVSDELIASVARPTPTYVKVATLYRQHWTGSAYEYAAGMDITDQIITWGTIMWKLDNEEYGVWTLDNVTLTIRNERNQWLQGNAKGYFPTDYLRNKSKIRIEVGAVLANGTTEKVYAFTGFISGDPISNPEEKTINVTLTSEMSVFEKNDAEKISTLVEDELLGQNSGTVFTTDYNGAAAAKAVIKKGTTTPAEATELKANIDYSLSNYNVKGTPMTVTLKVALESGEKLWATYIYWYTDKTLEWIAGQVMTLCGIGSYEISPAVFSTSVENIWTQTTEADWEAGTLTNIDTNSTPGSFRQQWHLIDDFSDGNYSVSPIWYVDSGSWTVSSGVLISTGGGTNIIDLYALAKAYGTWEFRAWVTDITGYPLRVYFCYYSGWFTAGGYFLEICTSPSPGKISLYKCYRAYETAPEEETLLGTSATPIISTDTMRITRNSSGDFVVYVNGVSKITATDTQFASSQRFRVKRTGGYQANFDDLRYSYEPTADAYSASDPLFVSSVHDCAGDLASYGKVASTYFENNGTVTIYSYSSDTVDFSSGNDPQGWIALSGTGYVQSAVKRYIKFKVALSLMGYDLDSPIFASLIFYYYTSTIQISLVDLTGKTCMDLLTALAKMCNYEIGFKSNGTFIFRGRITDLPSVLELRSETNIREVSNYTDGVERVYNHIRAQFGVYVKDSDASGDAEPNSITQYERRKFEVSDDGLLPVENANVAYAVAPTILIYTKNPRKRVTIKTKMILHCELGDNVQVFYDEATALRRWRVGDTDVVLGQADLELYSESVLQNRYNLWDKKMRVEGIMFDLDEDKATSFDLVEAL